MSNWKHIKDANPIDVPLTCRLLERDEYTLWIHDETKTIYWIKKPWYSKERVKGKTSKRKGWL